jgi:acyl-CoA thioester hydrolase
MRFFEQTLGVYFDDLDPFHILHNARYVLLFERTLGAFWMDLGLGAFQDEGRPEQFHLVARNEIDYLTPVRGAGKVRVRVWVERIGTTSLTFAFRLLPHDQDIDHARGRRTIVHVDPSTLRPLAWASEVRDILAPWTEAPAPSAGS